MKVKKYVANTMPEAMKVIRKELGSEAVILQSKEVKRKGFLGLFNKTSIEVIAALDSYPVERKKKALVHDKEVKNIQTKPVSLDEKNNLEILAEIKQLKKILELQTEKFGNLFSPDGELVLHHLLEQDVDPALAEELIHSAINKYSLADDTLVYSEIMQAVQAVMKERLEEFPSTGITGKHKIVQFVGPTGVGKTTTIAKIAANLILKDKKKVAFITTDTYRIAAIEQLKTYARILSVPVEVAYNVQDYEKAIQNLNDYDVIFVDTAGRNFRDAKHIHELKMMMGDFENIATYLVLSLTAKPKDMMEIYDQFYQIPLTEVIFTKLDETAQYGSLINIVLNKQTGIAYFTNGQDVPDNLLQLSAKEISELITGEQDE